MTAAVQPPAARQPRETPIAPGARVELVENSAGMRVAAGEQADGLCRRPWLEAGRARQPPHDRAG